MAHITLEYLPKRKDGHVLGARPRTAVVLTLKLAVRAPESLFPPVFEFFDILTFGCAWKYAKETGCCAFSIIDVTGVCKGALARENTSSRQMGAAYH